ncbi:MAG: hypothetical protein CSA11_01260 [Chloroflexi bacterium]|nr:MAG: hypothetical protein CSA11_01260 [Chloroflexota bacterium]
MRATNNTCAAFIGNDQNTGWLDVPLNLVADVVGNLYEGEGHPSPTMCTGPHSPVSFPTTTNRTVSATPGGTSHTARTSTYTLSDVPYLPNTNWGGGNEITLALTNGDMSQALACQCPSPSGANPFTCSYNNVLTPVNAAAHPVNFWLQEYSLVHGPWWQTWGGMVYAATGVVVSDIPQPCINDSTGYCRSYIVAADSAESPDSAGVPMSGTGAYSSGAVAGYFTDRATQQVAEGTTPGGHLKFSLPPIAEGYAAV